MTDEAWARAAVRAMLVRCVCSVIVELQRLAKELR